MQWHGKSAILRRAGGGRGRRIEIENEALGALPLASRFAIVKLYNDLREQQGWLESRGRRNIERESSHVENA